MITSLNELKEKMVNEVIEQLIDMRYMTSKEKDLYKRKLLSNLQNNKLTTTVREQSGLTNAYDYNQTAYELYLDILTTFYYIDNLYNALQSHQKLNESIITTLHSTIGELNDQLTACEAVIGTEGAPQCYYEGLRTINNQETDKMYYTERYGEKMPEDTYVRFNSDQENITLNYTRQQNVMVYKSGVQLGEISITKQYGAGFIVARNSESKLSNAIDTSNSSYWSETILTNQEIKIKGLNFTNSDGLYDTNRSYYNLPRGALCEICLTFEALTKVNELILKPYGNFPIDIIAIRYQLSDDEDDTIYDVIYPGNENELLATTSIDKEHAFHFKTITCKKLYILINQIHCIKDTYMLSTNQMFKNELWFNATYELNDKIKMDNSTVFQPLYLDRGLENNIWKYINNKMITNKLLDINELLIKNEEKYLPVTKYQYNYGFYNIAPCFSEYQKAGIYVSKVIECDGSVDTIKLVSDETHPLSSDQQILTDIEFYITTKRNPEYNDWIPICPSNKDYVHHELLQLDHTCCYLRHKAVCGNIITYNANGNETTVMERPIVYYNDIVLTEDADYILRYDNDGNVNAIEIAGFDNFAIYTVSYMPLDASKEITLINDENPQPSNTFQEIIGTGSACYCLDECPYYNRQHPDDTMTYVKIIDVETNLVLNQNTASKYADDSIECVTDKLNPASSFKNFVANTNKIQYYTNGRYLYFNKPIAPTQKIEISYPSFGSQIRLKAILRRNTKHDNWLTPILNSYKLEFTTL